MGARDAHASTRAQAVARTEQDEDREQQMRDDADAGEAEDSSRGADGGDAQPEPEPERSAVSLAKGNKGLFDDKTNEAYKFPYWAPDARKDVIGKPEPMGQVRAARDTSTLPDLLFQY